MLVGGFPRAHVSQLNPNPFAKGAPVSGSRTSERSPVRATRPARPTYELLPTPSPPPVRSRNPDRSTGVEATMARRSRGARDAESRRKSGVGRGWGVLTRRRTKECYSFCVPSDEGGGSGPAGLLGPMEWR